MNKPEYKEFWIFGGMGGGFNDFHFLGCAEAESIDSPSLEQDAFQLVTEQYESYAGLHGILSYDDVFEMMCDECRSCGEPLPSDEEVQEAYENEITSWTTWRAMEAIPGENPEDPKWLNRKEW